jgi:chemotaxis protein methyltransferase CheR
MAAGHGPRTRVTLGCPWLDLLFWESYVYWSLSAFPETLSFDKWMPLVTTTATVSGETFFFRDHGQFNLLRLHLLPELIESRRDARSLRLWSVGCSSGEEPYSLAMLLDELLPQRQGWNIQILGTDIDESALTKARRALYGRWSFRGVPDELRSRYFLKRGEEWLLDERVRTLVTFRRHDMVRDPFPPGEMSGLDLILCRNVFIYFDGDTVALVAAKLVNSLGAGGYLMTAHTELSSQSLPQLQCRLFPESVVYQRVESLPGHVTPPEIILLPLSHAETPAPVTAVPRSKPLARERLSDTTDYLAQARQHADKGEYGAAKMACHQALKKTPLAADPYFLLAQLTQLEGDLKGAMKWLDKTIYLDPDNVAAHLELAALGEHFGNLSQAVIHRRAALAIIRALPPDRLVEPYGNKAAEMADWLAQWAPP